MLAKQQRLTKNKDLEKVFQQGRTYYSKLLGAGVLTNQLQSNRFALIVSAKVSRKAVERNKLKRQIRQAIRELNSQLAKGVDLVIIARPALLQRSYQAIKSGLKKVLAGLNLLK
jgi:ribonuclease P protein component